jgi:uncharacterized protein (DUF2147 family)
MKFLIKLLTLSFLFLSVFCLNATAQTMSPVGYWKTVDDKTGEVLSVVQIYSPGDTLAGKIVQIMPVLGQKVTDRCVKCEGNLQNQPMMGLGIIWGMQQLNQITWGRGRVLDPKSGNIYRGTMTLVNNGQALQLRGYIGIPIFGRTETWIRTNRP